MVSASNPGSRPKVHRLPAPRKSTRKHIAPQLFGLGFVAAATLAGWIGLNFYQPEQVNSSVSHNIGTAGFMPSVSEAAASTLSPEKDNKTIVIQSNNDTIVGQMAHIPAQNEQITEVKTASDIDNNAGRELLSIISKY